MIVSDIDELKGKSESDDINLQINKATTFIKCDISKEDEVKLLIAITVKIYGKIDTLINNAAHFVLKGFEATKEEWLRGILS